MVRTPRMLVVTPIAGHRCPRINKGTGFAFSWGEHDSVALPSRPLPNSADPPDPSQLKDSPMYHMVIMQSRRVDIVGLSVTVDSVAVGDVGPYNTDGVSIIASSNVSVRSSSIESGDDNIVIKEASRGILGTDLVLTRGKGISIGSLGERAADYQVLGMWGGPENRCF